MFAVGDTVWLALIGLFTIFANAVALLVKDFIDRGRAEVAAQVVKAKLEVVTSDQAALAATTATKIDAVIAHTNGMKDELVREVRAASFAAGEKSEKEKQPEKPNAG